MIVLTILFCAAINAGEWINGVLQDPSTEISNNTPAPVKNNTATKSTTSKTPTKKPNQTSTAPVKYHTTTIDPKQKSELTTLEELREEGKLLWKKLKLEMEKKEKNNKQKKKIELPRSKNTKTAPVVFYQG